MGWREEGRGEEEEEEEEEEGGGGEKGVRGRWVLSWLALGGAHQRHLRLATVQSDP